MNKMNHQLLMSIYRFDVEKAKNLIRIGAKINIYMIDFTRDDMLLVQDLLLLEQNCNFYKDRLDPKKEFSNALERLQKSALMYCVFHKQESMVELLLRTQTLKTDSTYLDHLMNYFVQN